MTLVITSGSPDADKQWLTLAARMVAGRLLEGEVNVKFKYTGCVEFTYSDNYVKSPVCVVAMIVWIAEVRKYAA